MDDSKREEAREPAETAAAEGSPGEGVLAKAARTIGSVVAAVTKKTGLAGKAKPAAPAKKTSEKKSSQPATKKPAATTRKSGSAKKSGKKSGAKRR